MALLEKSVMEVLCRDGKSVQFEVDPAETELTMKIGKETVRMKRSELWAVVYAISGGAEQEKMMPVRQTEVMHFTKVHMVKLKKDMKKDQIMKVRCHQSVPLTVVEGLKGMVVKEAKKEGIPIIR